MMVVLLLQVQEQVMLAPACLPLVDANRGDMCLFEGCPKNEDKVFDRIHAQGQRIEGYPRKLITFY